MFEEFRRLVEERTEVEITRDILWFIKGGARGFLTGKIDIVFNKENELTIVVGVEIIIDGEYKYSLIPMDAIKRAS